MSQSADVMNDTGDMVRVMRHPDGTRAIYQRQQGWRGMRCSTYSASGRLAAVNDYTEGKRRIQVREAGNKLPDVLWCRWYQLQLGG